MIMINLVGILLIAAIVWWFWLYKPADLGTETGELLVTVENGVYQPTRLKVPAGKPLAIHFLRKDASPCAATVVFSALNISEELPLNQKKTIHLPALTPGSYSFTCQMQMYRGELIVSDKT